ILRADIGADVASLDRAVKQGSDRLGETLEGKGGQLRWGTAGGKRQRRGHALLGGDELHIGAQPAAQRVDRRSLALQLLAELLDLAAIDGLIERLARRKMAIERADADAGFARDRFQARIRAAGAEYGLGRLQHAVAIPQRVGARLAGALCGANFHPGRLVTSS